MSISWYIIEGIKWFTPLSNMNAHHLNPHTPHPTLLYLHHIHTYTHTPRYTSELYWPHSFRWLFECSIDSYLSLLGSQGCECASAIDQADRDLWSWDRSGVFVFHGGGGTIPATHTSLGWTLSGPLHCFSWRPPESDDSKGLWPGSSSQFPLLKLDSMHSRKPFWV